MPERILIVDDDEFMRSSLQLELESEGYEVHLADNGLNAIELAKDISFDLILCDVRMPGINGLETIAAIKEYQPVARNIIITAYANPDAPITALKMRVDDYLMKPFSSEDLLKSVRTSLAHYTQSAAMGRGAVAYREGLLKLISGIFFESRISYLVGHSERIARLCLKIGRHCGFSPPRIQNLYIAALLHDIGYVDLPHHLFEKKEFKSQDYELMRSHPLMARDLLIGFTELRDVATFILHHHERWDGDGYPRGLKGEEIPLESRIIAVAEAYDSLVSERPHRMRRGVREALTQLQKDEGAGLDPELVKILAQTVQIFDDGEKDGVGSDNIPSHIPMETERRAAFLLNLAHVYRDSGDYEIAEKAYSQAEDLLSKIGSPIWNRFPELYMQIKLGKISLMTKQGLYRDALDIAQSCQALSREKSMQFLGAHLSVQSAYLKMNLEDYEGVRDELIDARKTYETWESSYNVCETDLLLSALFALQAKDKDEFDRSFHSFLHSVQSGKFYDLLNKYREILLWPLKYAIDNEYSPGEIVHMLKESTGSPVQILEKLMNTGDVQSKLKVLDILNEIKDERAHSLLSKARLDPDLIVSQKSALLLRETQKIEITPIIQVFLFGKLRILVGSTPLDDEMWVTRKARSLFAYLASRRGEAQSEEKLMDLFWFQCEDKARHSLHNSISLIRKIFAHYLGKDAKNLILKKRDGYLLNRKINCWIDLEEFEEHYYKGKTLTGKNLWQEALLELQKAERLYTGEFLEGSYDEWSDDPRLKTRGKYQEVIQSLAKYFFNRKKYEVSIDYWKKILSADNCHEDAYHGLMVCYAAINNQSEAIKTYHACHNILKKELNLAPPPKIMETYLRLLEGKPVDLVV